VLFVKTEEEFSNALKEFHEESDRHSQVLGFAIWNLEFLPLGYKTD